MTLPFWFQTSTLVALGVLLVVDLAVVARRPHIPSLRECGFWVTGYVALALVFAVVLYQVSGGEVAGQFVSGWLTEYSLSVDNLFVFVLIMSRFAVPRGNQQKVLMMGIILSLVLRGACIAAGAAAIERFSWVFYLFGAFLVYTAVGFLRGSDDEGEFEENVLIRQARRLLPIAPGFDGARLVTVHDGRRVLTPMMIVFLAIGSTDLLFAVDSIPAIFGLTQDPFIVFTATLFALMGLRQLYFLLGGLLDRLVYLSVGLSAILGFIGVKMVLEALHTNDLGFLNDGEPVHWAPDIPTVASLGVIVVVLAVTTVVSLLSSRREPRPASPAAPAPAASVAPAAPVGQAAVGQAPVGQAPVGQASVGQASVGQAPLAPAPGGSPVPGAASLDVASSGAEAAAGGPGEREGTPEQPRPGTARTGAPRPEPGRPRQPHPPGARGSRSRSGGVPGPSGHQTTAQPGQVRD